MMTLIKKIIFHLLLLLVSIRKTYAFISMIIYKRSKGLINLLNRTPEFPINIGMLQIAE